MRTMDLIKGQRSMAGEIIDTKSESATLFFFLADKPALEYFMFTLVD